VHPMGDLEAVIPVGGREGGEVPPGGGGRVRGQRRGRASSGSFGTACITDSAPQVSLGGRILIPKAPIP
jgi:hypothetical protein